jgi:hypothetical protein
MAAGDIVDCGDRVFESAESERIHARIRFFSDNLR